MYHRRQKEWSNQKRKKVAAETHKLSSQK